MHILKLECTKTRKLRPKIECTFLKFVDFTQDSPSFRYALELE